MERKTLRGWKRWYSAALLAVSLSGITGGNVNAAPGIIPTPTSSIAASSVDGGNPDVVKAIHHIAYEDHVGHITNNYSFMGTQTISRDVFVQILRENHSPAESNGNHLGGAMWDASVAEGVDPNLILTIYLRESHYGTDGNSTLNICNMKYAPGVTRRGNFADFKAQYGMDGLVESTRACATMIAGHYKEGYRTVPQLIFLLTPPSDGNNTWDYIYGEHGVLTTMKKNYRRSIAAHPPTRYIQTYTDDFPQSPYGGIPGNPHGLAA